MEIWKDVKGYEGIYFISNEGRLKNKYWDFVTPKILNGYKRYSLSKDGIMKYEYAHRLVAINFIENIYKYKEINHKDENKSNNCVDNLEWCSRKYNMNYSKRSNKARKVINLDTQKTYKSVKAAIDETGIKTIRQCCNGSQNTAGGFRWSYLEENPLNINNPKSSTL